MKSKKVFAAVLRGLKASADVPWHKVSQATGITKSTLSGYANGVRYPRDENFQKIAEFFRLSPQDLRGLEAQELTLSLGRQENASSRAVPAVASVARGPNADASRASGARDPRLTAEGALLAELEHLHRTLGVYHREIARMFLRLRQHLEVDRE